MKKLIKKILKEEFNNPEVMSPKRNICDVMSVNSWDEIQELLDNMEYDENYESEIHTIYNNMVEELEFLQGDYDVYNNYLREIQNLLCK